MTHRKNNFNAKKVIASLVAAGVLASGSVVFAEYDPDKVVDTSLEYTTLSAGEEINASEAPETTEIPQDIVSADYNGATILSGTEEVDGHIMFPVRYVFESLGYEVTWVEELQKIQLNRGAVEIGMYTGQNSYYFAKTMPGPLGAAPVLVDGETTYAPVELLTDIAGVKVVFDGLDGTILIVDPAEVSFKSLETDENNLTRLTVNDARLGEVIVFVTEDTEITVNGAKGSLEDLGKLESNQQLKVGYDAAMTMSLPPQTTAISVEIESSAAVEASEEPNADTVEFSGVIVELEDDRVVIDENGYKRALTVTDDVRISHNNDKRIYKLGDLTVGSEIKGVRSSAETKSIPPISAAVSIEILNLAE